MSEEVLTPIASFRSLVESLPVFRCDASKVHILDEPADFYRELEKGILSAKTRIVLASLYLGEGEKRVAEALHKALANNPDLEVTLLLDYFRGTRGSTNSVSLLAPLVEAFRGRVAFRLYHTPALGTLLQKIVPPRFNEGFGLQHMKIYIFDDDVMLSGANLNTDYFVNRQDRYVIFRDTRQLTDYYADLVDVVGSFSFKVSPDTVGPPQLHPPFARSDGRLDRPALKENASRLLRAFCERWHAATAALRKDVLEAVQAETARARNTLDTLVLPLIQVGPLGIRQEEDTLNKLLAALGSRDPGKTAPGTDLSTKWTVHLSSGYLNFPKFMVELLANSAAVFRILTSAPEANGFFGSKGVSRHLPAAYTYLEKKLLQSVTEVGRRDTEFLINEWKKPGWTFHGKGLWCTPPKESDPVLTVIGSSNFGYRSAYRDVEAQAVLITANKELRGRMKKNLDALWAHSDTVTRDDLNKPERVVHPGVAITTRVIRTML
ncbi:uncharacterized protein EV422DRAFT_563471 [Fimicolochytrium jonesii]|uniref:uncharacterized protein n=1 Tax=Fimicolochytrium jonesii TaxID=1396493 RepID=UPI0022FF1FA6|nr:uncharacterized protein EV422DRAFT_563471 [Fimicolochytrium jonesii]KAI8825642.1 hypothetical protein EV422DRAFT_563471 [Fimicolochytrium jonesii]